MDKRIADDLVVAGIGFITTEPCKQLLGVIAEVDARPELHHVPCNREDEGMGRCAGAWMGASGPASSCRTPRWR